ncbi:6-phosphogluconolactonase [Candidatus Profftia tarda]|nr:6-phosphogluconolactonase [Candidatus Profftia tarda]
MISFQEFPNVDKINKYFSEKIAVALSNMVSRHGKASLVVSGGSTPLELFKSLAKINIQWSKVIITLADERWVDPIDDSSNEKLVREYLLKDYASDAEFISLKNNCANPFTGSLYTEHALDAIARPFDIVVLGMGDDGHTASLFPGVDNLDTALSMNSGRICIGIRPITARFDRITLTLPALLNSRNIYLYFTGNTKLDIYQRATQGTDLSELPIRAILQQNTTPVHVYWTS